MRTNLSLIFLVLPAGKRIFPGVFFPELEGRHNVSGFILIKKNEGMQQYQKLEGGKTN